VLVIVVVIVVVLVVVLAVVLLVTLFLYRGHGRVELYLYPHSGPHRSYNGITLPLVLLVVLIVLVIVVVIVLVVVVVIYIQGVLKLKKNNSGAKRFNTFR